MMTNIIAKLVEHEKTLDGADRNNKLDEITCCFSTNMTSFE